jgi:predicted DNA-binding transcriptional regulator YafY
LPIEYDSQRNGYFIARDSKTSEISLPGPMYTIQEIHALLVIQDLINQLQSGLLDEHLGPMRERLKLLLGGEDLRSEEIRRRIRILHMASRPVAPKSFQKVSEATLTRKRIHISYYSRVRDDFTERDLSPQRLVLYRGNWYHDAWCHLREDLRRFAVDAIEDMEVLLV